MPFFAELDRLRTDLDALCPLAPEQEARVLQKFRLEWNYNSNAIEGNSLTLGETRSLLLHGVAASGKSIRDHDDIRNHNKVVAEVELLSTETRPVTEHLIREMHEILMGREPYYVEARTAEGAPTRQLIQPGTYKRNPNQALTATGEKIFFASPEETPAEMTALLAWYREQEEISTLHPVALAAEFHYRFVRIHPFDDGNGRMSRLLMNLILLRHGYPMTVIQAADRNRYLAALAEADAGEPEPFLRFIIENVEAGLRLMIRAARGESIDEPSDLDKKLALLNKQLDAPITKSESTWNLSFQSSFVENTVSPWLINLSGSVSKLDFLFARKMMYLQGFTTYYGLPVRSISTTNANIDSVINFLNREVKMNLLLDSVQLIFQWDRLKNNLNFNVNLVIEFLFNSETFSIKTKILDSKIEHSLAIRENNTLLFSGDYQNNFKEQDIDTINYQLANEVYDFIAAKLAETDTPPA